MPHLHDKNKKQPKSSAAANSPHFQQAGITSFMPPQFKATAGPIPQMKENEEEKAEALQKKQAQSEVEGKNNNSFAGGDAPVTPPNPNENILATLQRKHNAYRPEPKQYKRYELPTQQKAVKQFKQVEPFQLKDSPAYQKSQDGLPQEVQAKMENSMGHDFSNVNIHKDSSNATDAGALAYAQGNDVHFAPGQFKPDTTSGQELIGHELAHVVQQREGRVKPTKVLGKGMAVNDDPGLEKEADEMGRKAARGDAGAQLPLSPIQAKQSVVQRAVETSGGTWDTEQYDLRRDVANGNNYPPNLGVRGLDIKLKFTPNDTVNASKIGLTQTAQSVSGDTHPFIDGNENREDRAITEGDERGTMIDRADERNNPIYGSEVNTTGNLEDTPESNNQSGDPTEMGTNATYQLGYRYKNGENWEEQDAKLYDGPTLSDVAENSKQEFETTALAIEGNQKNAYYGSVKWGWQTDGDGNFTSMPLGVKSQGVPTATFMRAAEIWNGAQDSSGNETVNLPLVNVKVSTAPITAVQAPDAVDPAFIVPTGTRVQVIGYGFFTRIFNAIKKLLGFDPTLPKLKIVDGEHTGEVFDVRPEDLENLESERE